MIIESVVIIMVIAAVAFGYLRSSKAKYAIITLPLLIVPFFNVISEIVCESISKPNKTIVSLIINIVGLLITAVLLLPASKNLSTRKKRMTYFILSLVYTIGLIIIFVSYRMTV